MPSRSEAGLQIGKCSDDFVRDATVISRQSLPIKVARLFEPAEEDRMVVEIDKVIERRHKRS